MHQSLSNDIFSNKNRDIMILDQFNILTSNRDGQFTFEKINIQKIQNSPLPVSLRVLATVAYSSLLTAVAIVSNNPGYLA